jgi:uncharacterized protein with GYD domain
LLPVICGFGRLAFAMKSHMGEYDLVGIVEFPSDEGLMTFNLKICSQGGVRSTTLKAFALEEFAEMVKKIP